MTKTKGRSVELCPHDWLIELQLHHQYYLSNQGSSTNRVVCWIHTYLSFTSWVLSNSNHMSLECECNSRNNIHKSAFWRMCHWQTATNKIMLLDTQRINFAALDIEIYLLTTFLNINSHVLKTCWRKKIRNTEPVHNKTIDHKII